MTEMSIEESVQEELVYIGAAPMRDLWQRISDRKGDPEGNFSQAEKDLRQQGLCLEFSYAVLPQDEVPSGEASLLRAYEAKHGAKPPGNTRSAHAPTITRDLDWSEWLPLKKENGVYRVRVASGSPPAP